MKRTALILFAHIIFVATSLFAQNPTNSTVSAKENVEKYLFQDPSVSIEKRVENLVSLLTLDEKISLMVNASPAIKRLNIPAYNWWNETLHGVARSPYHVTSYPQAIALAATWDTLALKKMADYCAVEGRAIFNDSQRKGKTGIYLGLTYWTPNINIFRDPRWGRGQETYGEDPYLTGTLGKAFVRGLEGDDPRYLKASACAKHFAVHSGPEWSRSTYNAKVSDFDLWDTYLPAFRDLIVDAKVSGVMCAYNAFDGQPCCGSDKLMQKILRDDWGFKGYVTSDCGGIGFFWRTHKTHESQEKAAADAVLHGTDCECSGKPTYFALQKAIKDGLITESQIDVSVKRLFTIRFRLGMFDPKELVPFSKIDTSVLENPAHQAHALKLAQESMVLLKNDRQILPLSRNLKKVAVVGPNADDKSTLLANYYGYPSQISSVLDGIQQKIGDKVVFEKGVNWVDNKVFKPNYPTNAFSFEGKMGFQAEYFKNPKFQGKPAVVGTVKKIDFQWGDGENVAEGIIANSISIRFSADFTPSLSDSITFELKGDDRCRLFVDGEKRIETDLKNGYYTFKTEKGKTYKVVVEYEQYSDNAEIKLDMGIIESAMPQTIAERVKDADVIVFVGGISAKLEGEAMPVTIDGFKGGDRTHIGLPTVQTDLMKALKMTGKPLVFVNMSGGAMGFEWEATNANAIVQAWYGGQSGGQAVADVLFGDYNPSGRLPVTFYKNVNDLPDFEDYNMDNRTYRYYKGEPLYPFGFGLSYTHFQYKKLKITPLSNGGLKVHIQVHNTGKTAGDEVVQLYVSHKNAPFKTPIRALKGYKRVALNKGQSQNLSFELDKKDLLGLDTNGKPLVFKGDLEVSVGGSQPSEKAILEKKVSQKVVKTL
jgi:beta-glucosidase